MKASDLILLAAVASVVLGVAVIPDAYAACGDGCTTHQCLNPSSTGGGYSCINLEKDNCHKIRRTDPPNNLVEAGGAHSSRYTFCHCDIICGYTTAHSGTASNCRDCTDWAMSTTPCRDRCDET